MNEADPKLLTAEELLEQIRGKGWNVAVHNDYKIGTVHFTFWLFSKDCFSARGEGTSDRMALLEAAIRIKKVEGLIELIGPAGLPDDLKG